MLSALYDYGIRNADKLPFRGYGRRSLKYIIELSGSGDFVDIRELDAKFTFSPDSPWSTAGKTGFCNPFVEKASVVLNMLGDDNDTLIKKIKCYRDYISLISKAVSFYAFVDKILCDDDLLLELQVRALDIGIKPEDVVAFSVDGVLLHTLPEVANWWSDYLDSHAKMPSDNAVLDVVTGEPCVPVRTFGQIKEGKGLGFVTFNFSAGESYGLSQCENCPVSEKTADVVMRALNDLWSKAVLFDDFRYMYWYKGDAISQEDDLLSAFFGSVSPLALAGPAGLSAAEKTRMAENSFKSLLASVRNGHVPSRLKDAEYHMLVIKSGVGRVSVRQYSTGRYDDLYDNISRWYDSMAIVSGDGVGEVVPVSFMRTLRGFLSDSELASSKSREFGVMNMLGGYVLSSVLTGSSIPDMFLTRILSNIMSDVHGENHRFEARHVQLLRLVLIYHSGYLIDRGCVSVMLNVDSASPAYHCGRLLAVYERIQDIANSYDSGRNGILERFYGYCLQNPQQAFPLMMDKSTVYMSRIENKALLSIMKSHLESIYEKLPEFPKRFSSVDKAEFSLGYWHQRAFLNKERAERSSAKQKED